MVVRDYFRDQKDLIPWTKQATELIGWLRGKSLVLAMLRKVREEAGLPVLSVLKLESCLDKVDSSLHGLSASFGAPHSSSGGYCCR